MACKNKWLNLRDQYRRTIRKQRLAASQGIKRKKWRFDDDMNFLQPFFREKTSNPDSFNTRIESDEDVMKFDEEGDETILSSTDVLDDPFRGTEKTITTEKDPLDAFFVAMAESVKTFPPLYQHIAKKRVFNVISGIEIEILQGTEQSSICQPMKEELLPDA